MNKQQFEQQKRLLWVFLRNNRTCAICGGEVNPREVATNRDIAANTGIDDLLQVMVMHPFCKAAQARRQEKQAA